MIVSPNESQFCSDDVIHQIQNINPDRSPHGAARPLSPDVPAFSDDESSGMTLDPQSTPTLDSSMLSDFGSPRSRAVDREGGALQPGSESPPQRSLLMRIQLPLAQRIQEPADTPENELPSIFDFFNNAPRYRRPFGPLLAVERSDWHFYLEETNPRVRERVQEMVDTGALSTNEALVRYAVRHRMGFLTIAARLRDDDVQPPRGGPQALHEVDDSMRILPSTPPSQRVDRWARGVREILSRPHARAALTQGGLTARLAEWAGLTVEHALAGPSRMARVLGGPRTFQPPAATGPQGLHIDDWLSEEEVATLMGLVQDGTAHGAGSLWPAPATLNHNWWQGAWTDEHERWFEQHLRELLSRRNQGPIRTRGEWRTHFRRLDHDSNGGHRQGRNG